MVSGNWVMKTVRKHFIRKKIKRQLIKRHSSRSRKVRRVRRVGWLRLRWMVTQSLTTSRKPKKKEGWLGEAEVDKDAKSDHFEEA